MEGITQLFQNFVSGVSIVSSSMAYSPEFIEYGIYISLMLLLISALGIKHLRNGRKSVSFSAGGASFLAILPAWFVSAEIGVAIFCFLIILFFVLLSKKNPGYKGENLLHAVLLAGLPSTLGALVGAFRVLHAGNYLSQMNVPHNFVYGLAPLFVFLLFYLIASRIEHEKAEKERIEAKRLIREQVREELRERRAQDALHNDRAKPEEKRIESEGQEPRSSGQSLEQDDVPGLKILFGEEEKEKQTQEPLETEVADPVQSRPEQEIKECEEADMENKRSHDQAVEMPTIFEEIKGQSMTEPRDLVPEQEEVSAMQSDEFCAQQEEYFKQQYEFITKQTELYRQKKEYYEEQLSRSAAQLEFYSDQAERYLRQIEFYKNRREAGSQEEKPQE